MQAKAAVKKVRTGLHPGWWTLLLIVAVVAFVGVSSALFAGSFRSSVPVTLSSDRSGLVMETGAKVKLRGVQVGRVAAVNAGQPVTLRLDIDPDAIRYIPANVEAEIKATTAFGSKYVDLQMPADPSGKRLAAGMVVHSKNVTTEVNTVFQSLVGVLKQIDVVKLNSTLTAFADALRGQGARIGEATTDANRVLGMVNPRMPTITENWRSLRGFADAYGAAAQDILATLDAASTTSQTIVNHSADFDAFLLNSIGFADAGIDVLGNNQSDLIRAINIVDPTTNLLMKYNPEYTCLLVGAKRVLDDGAYDITGGANGKSMISDSAFVFGDDPYQYPDNLPIIGAKGGPGGKPSCGSLPDAAKNFPVRQLITNTGWGTGLDIRPNPGLGHPCWVDMFPATRAQPQPASLRQCLPGPAPGPIPYPGAPPYGAPMYGPDGTPLYAGVPPAPSPAAPEPAPGTAEQPTP